MTVTASRINDALDHLPPLHMGEHYARVTFPLSWCDPDEGMKTTAARLAKKAGLRVMLTRQEGGTMAVYVREPDANDVRGWDRYRCMPCTSAQRVA